MPAPPEAHTDQFLLALGDSATARAICAVDWSRTTLGAMASWPVSLRTAVGLIVRSPAAMALLWGPDGVLLYNDAYAVIAGERHPAVLGLPVAEAWPEVADFQRATVQHVLSGQTQTHRDQPFTLQRNGRTEQAWFTLDYSPVLDESGQPAGVLALVLETTDNMLAQQWLRAERERLRQMFEQSPGFMAMLHGPQHTFDLANPAYLQLVGHRAVLGKTVRDALPELEGQGFYELLDKVYSSGEAFAGTAMPVLVQATPGAAAEQRFVDLVYQPVRDPAGQTLGIFVQGADVTPRVMAERAVQLSEARNRQILNSATDYAIVAFDVGGHVTRWNRGAERVLGWTEAEMLGGSADCIFLPDDRAAGRLQQEMDAALRNGAGSGEGWRLRKNGERFWASGEMTPLRDDDGAVVGFVKVLRDRTAEHAAAQALRASEQNLRRAQRAGGVGTFTLALGSNTLSGSSEFFRIFGLPDLGSVPASRIETLVLPEDAAIRSDALRRQTQDTQLDVEYRIRRDDDGALRWIARKAEFERDADGHVLRMVGAVQDVTQRKADQRALEESAAQFRTFAQALPNHVWTSPPDGVLDWFNDRVYDYSGVPQGTLNGGAWGQLIHTDDLPEATRRWTAALASGHDYEMEFRVLRADGAYRWHLARAVPIRTADGVISRWVGTNTDIHERKLAAAESTRDRDRIWQLSQELMLVCNFDGVIVAVNPAAKRLLGWTENEMVGELLSAYLHPDDMARTAAEVGKLSQGATTLAFENRYRAKDGSYLLLDWTAVPDGGFIHAVARNITGERAAAEERERVWSSVNDLMATATATADGSALLRAVNPAWQRLLGHALADLVQQPFASVVEAVDQERLRDAIVAVSRPGAAAAGTSSKVELRMHHRDGRQLLLAWTVEPVGDVLYLVGRDITEQRAMEDALRQSQKMEAVGQLTGGIAHDFNNLLQGITGSLNLLQKRIAQGRVDELDRFVGNAMNSARRAAALTHRLLAFSRRQPLDPRPVEANPLMASMEDLLHRTLGERVQLRMVLAPDLWLTRCDPNQLENAILNLAINSRDAMPDGGVLTIETANVTLDRSSAARQRQGVRAGRYVCISVSDTGTGMSPDTIAKAFEPFFTTKPLGQGTGLGLSMIYGFAHQSEGHAKIYSELGRGTTFKLYLPQFRGHAEPAQPLPALTGAHAAAADETVLVVEDEPMVRGLIVEVLGELGYRSLQAADGPAGLTVLQSDQRIDLLITDIGLPGLNGRQIADAGRLLRPQLKVLFMTGYAENATIASGFLEAGMAMITKPFAMEALATRVREVISAPGPGPGLPAAPFDAGDTEYATGFDDGLDMSKPNA